MSSGTKKPNGGKQLPRRLFSIESLKKQRSNSEDSLSSGAAHFRAQSSGSSNLLTLSEKIEEGIDPFGDGSGWTDKVVVQSPVDEENPSPFGDDVPTPRPPRTPTTARPADPRSARANIPPLNLGGTLVASIDDGAPRELDLLAGEDQASWARAVSDNVRIARIALPSIAAGRHRLRVWRIDPGVVLQRAVLSRAPDPPGYLGPPASVRR